MKKEAVPAKTWRLRFGEDCFSVGELNCLDVGRQPLKKTGWMGWMGWIGRSWTGYLRRKKQKFPRSSGSTMFFADVRGAWCVVDPVQFSYSSDELATDYDVHVCTPCYVHIQSTCKCKNQPARHIHHSTTSLTHLIHSGFDSSRLIDASSNVTRIS